MDKMTEDAIINRLIALREAVDDLTSQVNDHTHSYKDLKDLTIEIDNGLPPMPELKPKYGMISRANWQSDVEVKDDN